MLTRSLSSFFADKAIITYVLPESAEPNRKKNYNKFFTCIEKCHLCVPKFIVQCNKVGSVEINYNINGNNNANREGRCARHLACTHIYIIHTEMVVLMHRVVSRFSDNSMSRERRPPFSFFVFIIANFIAQK